MKNQLYWAYGSNLNVEQMRWRCPAARVVGAFTLPDAVLRFRVVADVAYLRGRYCPGGLWEITERCEAELDRYEGAPNLYSKKYLKLKIGSQVRSVLYYVMNRRGIAPPAPEYLATIERGYRDFGLDFDRLRKAVEHAERRNYRTPFIERRQGRMRPSSSVIGLTPPSGELKPALRKRRGCGACENQFRCARYGTCVLGLSREEETR